MVGENQTQLNQYQRERIMNSELRLRIIKVMCNFVGFALLALIGEQLWKKLGRKEPRAVPIEVPMAMEDIDADEERIIEDRLRGLGYID